MAFFDPVGRAAIAIRRRLRIGHRLFLASLKRRRRVSTASGRDQLPLDVVIPVIDRDLPCLDLVVEGARRNIAHKVGDIFLVGPPTPAIIGTAQRLGCIHVPEDDVIGIGKSQVRLAPRGIDRSGWIFQQLLKLSSDSISDKEHILVLDADTVLTRPQRFVVDGAPVFRVSDELHRPYFRNIARLLNRPTPPRFSFVAHHMLFERAKLRSLRARLEKEHGTVWHQAILRSIDPDETSGFSEYQLYGDYASGLGPARLEYWDNATTSRKAAIPLDTIEQEYAATCKSVSYHWYMA